MGSPEEKETRPLERVYQEASQWVRLVNTIIWSMGTLLVPGVYWPGWSSPEQVSRSSV